MKHIPYYLEQRITEQLLCFISEDLKNIIWVSEQITQEYVKTDTAQTQEK